MTPTQWQQGGRRFDWRDHDIFFRDEGSGDSALLCIHGFPTASWDWTPIWPALCQRFARVIAPDMLGFGFSAKPSRHNYSLMEQADLHVALLAHAGIRRVHILAHDYGVSVTQELLARQLENATPAFQIESVTLLNGGLFPETHRITVMQKILRSPLGSVATRLMTRSRFRKSFSLVFGPATKPGMREIDDFWQLIQYNNGARVMHRLIRYVDERRWHRERWVGALIRTPVPIRLINGPEDPVSGAHMVARYRELVPQPDVVSLDGIGHYPQVEAPQRTLEAFFAFLDRGSAASRPREALA
ncbi:MAG TPA: alpha/beta hydrolase [Stenotrophobium sp.]|jgi:pimeloyl-ACP methyl ester carboxylesterase|nr:alpha/beta hydrolase [Stenotrophobium sp.]